MTPLLLSAFLLAGADPEPASPPKGLPPILAYGSEKGGEIQLTMTKSIPVVEARVEKVMEGGKVVERVVQVTKHVLTSSQIVLPREGVTYATASGKKLDASEARKRLARGVIVAVSPDGNPVDPEYLKRFKPDLIVVTVKRAASSTDPAAPNPAPIPLPPVIRKPAIGR
jgi:hypothetical protein